MKKPAPKPAKKTIQKSKPKTSGAKPTTMDNVNGKLEIMKRKNMKKK